MYLSALMPDRTVLILAGQALGAIAEACEMARILAPAMVVLEDVGGAATALADDLQGRLERLGVYRREARPWLPHLTVLRRPERGGETPELANRCSIHVVRSALYRSSLAPGGARYDALETAALGGT